MFNIRREARRAGVEVFFPCCVDSLCDLGPVASRMCLVFVFVPSWFVPRSLHVRPHTPHTTYKTPHTHHLFPSGNTMPSPTNFPFKFLGPPLGEKSMTKSTPSEVLPLRDQVCASFELAMAESHGEGCVVVVRTVCRFFA